MKTSLFLSIFAAVSLSAFAASADGTKSNWRYNFLEMGVSTDSQGNPEGAVFSYSGLIPIAPKSLKEHLGIELKFQLPPLLPNLAFRSDGDQKVVDLYYGVKLGPAVRLNQFFSLSVVGGIYAVVEGRGYAKNMDAGYMADLVMKGGDVNANGAATVTWAMAIQPTFRVNLGALTLGASVEWYKNDREIAQLQSGARVTSPLASLNATTSVIQVQNAISSGASVNTDNLGQYTTTDGPWRTRFTLTVGASF